MFSVIVRGNLRVSFADWQQNTEARVSLRVRLGLLINHSWGKHPIRFVNPPVAATLPRVRFNDVLFRESQVHAISYDTVHGCVNADVLFSLSVTSRVTCLPLSDSLFEKRNSPFSSACENPRETIPVLLNR